MSAIAGDIPALMYFALEPPHYGTADAVGAVGAYSRMAQKILPGLLWDVTDESSGRFLLETLQGDTSSRQTLIRSAGWMQPGINGTYCAHIVVVNTDERPQIYKAILPTSGKGTPFGNLTKVTHALPDDSYSIPLEQDCGAANFCFGETIDGFSSVVLTLGCDGMKADVAISAQLPYMEMQDVYV